MSYQPPGPQSPPPGQPSQPGGQPAQPGPTGTIALTIQGSVMTSNMIVPTVKINGFPVPTRYGRQDIPVQPGPVHIEAFAQWMRTYGQAAMDFTVQPGQEVPVFYAAPMHQFTTGSMGHEKQKRKGAGAFLGLMGFLLLIVVCAVLVPVLTM